MQTPSGIQHPKTKNHLLKLLIPCTSVLAHYKTLQAQQLILQT